ncbi:NAD(P)/FAD-dependent oxidoreductase [Ruixingdingia sedimenti]|uniref:FAD-dependent oxidoreductase n=1 Tax=Ruixingdingia sedimenti TaxID=3073604 RepID=A0ABU1F2Y4_9RHOB|nr:FAD-dependent oxidoreductase [Xinfangfangia sp. LG-4]MDR5651229.1 FAD-dependent oxidoreductase [Xinfangfangia sp. LG-4]
MTQHSTVIAGAGQAGYQTAASLRQEGYDGRIVLIGDEPGLPYQRPPLSKAYMLGKTDRAGLQFKPEKFFSDNAIDLIHDSVAAIDRSARQVTLAGGGRHGYDHLVIATGARNRPLPVPGADLEGVMGLRTLADADALALRLNDAEDVVVIGAGFIGLEFAAVAAALGKRVQVIELAPRVMGRAVSVDMSGFFAAAHAGWGVTLLPNTGIRAIEGAGGKVAGIELSDGRRLPAQLVVFGIGVMPNAEIALTSGLPTPNGVEVDATLATSDPAVSAIGDVACFPCAAAGGRCLRLESVQNAADQGRALAARLMGKSAPYAAVPWFWSDQGDLKLQMVGLSDGHDRVIRLGDPATRSFTNLLYRGDDLIALESVNRAGDFMVGRKLFAGRARPGPAEAASEGFDLRAWEAAHR